jgi:hypothetical protein
VFFSSFGLFNFAQIVNLHDLSQVPVSQCLSLPFQSAVFQFAEPPLVPAGRGHVVQAGQEEEVQITDVEKSRVTNHKGIKKKKKKKKRYKNTHTKAMMEEKKKEEREKNLSAKSIII